MKYFSIQSKKISCIYYKNMNSLKQKVWINIIIIYTRYLIGGAFVFASLIKLKGLRFTSESGADAPINSAFHFFETMYQSGLYWQFIGLGQLLAGALLITQRYAKLGALLNLPIVANIFVITISYDFNYTPVITGLMLLANILLICWDGDQFRVLVNLSPIASNTASIEKYKTWEITGLVLFTFTFIYRLFVDKYDAIFWFSTCTLIGAVGLLLGLKKHYKSVF
jgi:hypothetical protein